MTSDKPSIEGEGSRTAARHYNEGTKEFVKNADVEQKAKDAKKAVEGPEGEELRDAEDTGRAAARGEDPQVKRP
jgi:hypothetical protein